MDNIKKLIKLLDTDEIDFCYNKLGKIFKTSNYTYFFDTGTGKVCGCGEKEEIIIELILNSQIKEIANLPIAEFNEAINNIIEFIENEKGFSVEYKRKFITFDKSYEDDDFKLEQIVLELTECCNLKCKYCIYNEFTDDFRNFSLNTMNFDIAKKGIDFALSHSSDELVIGFYGGEPLLKFDLIREIVHHVNKVNVSQKKIHYSITTNLILMDKEKADFFANLDSCSITCSIDGPKEIQDKYRVTTKEAPTFDDVVRGLHNLIDSFGDRAKSCISIYTVICPPFSKEKLDAIKNFFEGLDWLPEEVPCSYTRVKTGTLNKEDDQEIYVNKSLRDDPIREWALDNLINSKNIHDYVTKCEKANIMKIHNRLITNSPINVMPMNGCCVPGERRIYLTTQGDFKVCEKIGMSPDIGNVEKGIDKDTIYNEYIKKYCDNSLADCADCWAVNMCPICYTSCYNSTGINILEKRNLCLKAKKNVENSLIVYHEIMEKNMPLLIELLK